MGDKKYNEVLPATGIWSVQDLANYLGMAPTQVEKKLENLGIPILKFSSRYIHKLFRLEELKNCGGGHD